MGPRLLRCRSGACTQWVRLASARQASVPHDYLKRTPNPPLWRTEPISGRQGKKAKKKLVKLGKRGAKAKAKITVTLTDLAGNSTTEKVVVKLKK